MTLRRVLGWVALGVVGVGALKIAHSQQAPSGPPSPAVAAYLPPSPAPGSVFAGPLGGSLPLRIDIPDVGIHATLLKVGLQADGSVGVPPLNEAQRAAWYDGSPSPGEEGASIIDAHVDSRETAGFRGAFYNLGRMLPGEQIEITRSDHIVATFTVDSVQQAPKSAFPTNRVYGSVPYAALRLITCGGDFDYARGSYEDNTIVYAHMTDTSAN